MITLRRWIGLLSLCVMALGSTSCEYKRICEIEQRECGTLLVTVDFEPNSTKNIPVDKNFTVNVYIPTDHFEDCSQMKAYLAQGEAITGDILPITSPAIQNGVCEFKMQVTTETLSVLSKGAARLYVYSYDYGFTDVNIG